MRPNLLPLSQADFLAALNFSVINVKSMSVSFKAAAKAPMRLGHDVTVGSFLAGNVATPVRESRAVRLSRQSLPSLYGTLL